MTKAILVNRVMGLLANIAGGRIDKVQTLAELGFDYNKLIELDAKLNKSFGLTEEISLIPRNTVQDVIELIEQDWDIKQETYWDAKQETLNSSTITVTDAVTAFWQREKQKAIKDIRNQEACLEDTRRELQMIEATLILLESK